MGETEENLAVHYWELLSKTWQLQSQYLNDTLTFQGAENLIVAGTNQVYYVS
jgi:hypothetical protein